MESDWEWTVRNLINEGREDEALEVVNGVLEKNPGSKTALYLKAQIYELKTNYQNSLAIYETLLSLYEEKEDLQRQSHILSSIGDLYLNLDDPEKSIRCYSEVLAKLESIEEPLPEDLYELKALKLYDLATLAKEKLNYAEALTYYRKLLSHHRESGAKNPLIEDYSDIGDVYLKQKKYSEAKQVFINALEICNELGGCNLEASIRYNLGKSLFHTGEYVEAALQLSNSLSKFRQLESESSLFEPEFEERYQAERLLKHTLNKTLEMIEDSINEGDIFQAQERSMDIYPVIKTHGNAEMNATLSYLMAFISFNDERMGVAKTQIQKAIRYLKEIKSYKDSTLFNKIKSLLEGMKASEQE